MVCVAVQAPNYLTQMTDDQLYITHARSKFRLATFIRTLGSKEINGASYSSNREFDDSISPSAVTLNGDFLSPSSLSSTTSATPST